MGTTCSALHVMRSGADDAMRARVAAAYGHLGWQHAAGGDRRVALVGAPSARFATILDSACEALDDGTLKELGVALSRGPGRAAVFTSVYDSDSFAFILFADGRQVDAVTGGDDADAELVRLSADARAALLKTLFGIEGGTLPEGTSTVFAEDALGACCAAIGLDPAHATLRMAELAPGDIAAALAFHRGETSRPSGGPLPVLQRYHDHDDCPHHRVYPAAWPVPSTRAFGAKWIALSCAGGFDGLTVELNVSETRGTMVLERINIDAYPFYNGQITSPNPVASAGFAPGEPLADGPRAFRMPDYSIPDVDPEARKRIALLVWPEFRAEPGAAARIALRATPGTPGAATLELPPMRLHAPVLDRLPFGADPLSTDFATQRALLMLNEPSVLGCIAILGDDGDATRAAMQARAEDWIASLSPPDGATATLRTEKHMTASGSVTKKTAQAALGDIASDKLWRRAFAAKSDLQTIRLEIAPAGAPLPMAGWSVQFPLRDDTGIETPPAPHVSAWLAEHPEAWAALGTTPQAQETAFRDWLREIEPLQAFLLRAAWIPEFDTYDSYEQTPLEDLSGDRVRHGLRETVMSRAWCARRLRLVAPEMWLDRALMAQVDRDGLARVAHLDGEGGLTHLTLREGATLAALDAALEPLLPAQDR